MSKIYAILFSLVIFNSCRVTKKEIISQEKYRPNYHFTPDSMWMNDPNGLVYYKGEYHLFYQYHPFSTVWGPMHWGHAISKDLVHWQDLPIALSPDSLGYIFSGSVVIDYNNSSGFGSMENPPMVAIFTHHDMDGEKEGRKDFQSQSLAYSTDLGRTWVKYQKNPILKNPGIKDFRDPKVFWHFEKEKWIMTLAVYNKVHFYGSNNLKNWEFLSSFEMQGDKRLWECPDFFPIKVQNSDILKWCLIVSMQQKAPNGGSGTSYWIGDFDGKRFTGAKGKEDQKWLDYGTDNYAMVSFSNVLKRKILMGWMSNWQYAQQVPSSKWRGAMTMPREIKLFKTKEKYNLVSKPVEEMDSIIQVTKIIAPEKVSAKTTIAQGPTITKIKCKLLKPKQGSIYFNFSNKKGESVQVGYKSYASQWYIDRTKSGNTSFSTFFPGIHYAPEPLPELKSTDIEIWLDRSSIEVFIDDGRLVMTDIFFSEEGLDNLELISEDGAEVEILSGSVGYR